MLPRDTDFISYSHSTQLSDCKLYEFLFPMHFFVFVREMRGFAGDSIYDWFRQMEYIEVFRVNFCCCCCVLQVMGYGVDNKLQE